MMAPSIDQPTGKANFTRVRTDGGVFWYSYETLIAYKLYKPLYEGPDELHVHENVWGPTTGKHLNWINDDHSIREDEDTFSEALINA